MSTIQVDVLLEYLDVREKASLDSMESMDEFDLVRQEEQAILDTLELIRFFVTHNKED